MRVLFQSNRYAVSIMVSYVLLITITLSLSAIVYQWLKAYVEVKEPLECPDGVSLVITNYTCSKSFHSFSVTLKNKGRFNTSGFVIRVSDSSNSKFGVEEPVEPPLPPGGQPPSKKLFPGEERKFSYLFPGRYSDLKLIDIQPEIERDGKKIVCSTYTVQKVSCN
ncbi:hypothetical protein D6829_02680 [Candidatus Pacearchaeota archaeon]|nr:MAG: hypothetical protein D6829_02680 [Candidatus Pacearchaeota archaeon]